MTSTGSVAVVTIAHEARRNAFDDALLSAFVSTVEAAASEPSCAVVIVQADGPHFCAGWDVTTFQAMADSQVDPEAALHANHEQLEQLWRVPAVTIGAVRGTVAGFGVALLDRLHLAVASSTARVVLPEAGYGIAAGGVLVQLQRVLPPKVALDVLLSTEAIDARRACDLGLVSRVVADDALEQTVAALAERIAGHPGTAVEVMLDTYRRTVDAPRLDAMAAAAEAAARTIRERG